jgi:hypothetical protein
MPRAAAYDATAYVRLTRGELAALKAEAARHGRSLSRYLVERGLEPSAAMGPEQRLAHEQRMVQLRRIGASLTQIAAVLNAGRGVTTDRLSAALAEVTAAVAAVERERRP